MLCETTDFIYPMLADIYFPMITQSSYGQPKKEWVFDRTVAINAEPLTRKAIQDMQPSVWLQLEGKLSARVKKDPRKDSNGTNYALTNILVANLRMPNQEIAYLETSGPRNGKGTIFEIATIDPFIGGLQSIEYYQMLLRKAENQSVGD